MLKSKNKPIIAFGVWDNTNQKYLSGYRHPLDIATFRTVKGAKSAITHELKYAYKDPDKGKTYKDQVRFQIRKLAISDVGSGE
jgi:hypothetical protein